MLTLPTCLLQYIFCNRSDNELMSDEPMINVLCIGKGTYFISYQTIKAQYRAMKSLCIWQRLNEICQIFKIPSMK